LIFLALAAAAAAFTCFNPSHHDGDAIRCAGDRGRSMRLYGIDAPEMPGACRPGRACTPGDPYAARDHLAALTRGRNVTCEAVDTDHYGRTVVRCAADGQDISCAMVKDGYAVERYGRLGCDSMPTRALAENTAASIFIRPPFNIRPPFKALFISLYLLAINALTYLAFWDDKRRARQFRYRWAEKYLLILAFLGGAPAGVLAQYRLRHKTRKQLFSAILLAILGLQFGTVVGLAWPL
jgi:uncharacterized membrane protein YsdA (DUF1294 family)